MSGPNTDYDPVEVTPLKAEEVEAARDAALKAIDAASSLEELKQTRLDHAGDRSPLALANREIGALPPAARKEAGQRVGKARGAVNQAFAKQVLDLTGKLAGMGDSGQAAAAGVKSAGDTAKSAAPNVHTLSGAMDILPPSHRTVEKMRICCALGRRL